MNKEQAVLNIEKYIKSIRSDWSKGTALGYIHACFEFGLLSANEAWDFQQRVLQVVFHNDFI